MKKLNIDKIGKKVYKENDLIFDEQPQIYKNIVKSADSRIEMKRIFTKNELWNKSDEVKY